MYVKSAIISIKDMVKSYDLLKMKNIMSNHIWYGSVKHECFVKQQMEVRKLLRDAIFGE